MLLFSEFWLMWQTFLGEVVHIVCYILGSLSFSPAEKQHVNLTYLACFDNRLLKFFVVSCTNIFPLPGMI